MPVNKRTLAHELDVAREAVGRAMQDYSRGRASCDDVNKANRDLADVQDRCNEYTGDRVPDDRR